MKDIEGLDSKIASMIMVGFQGTTTNDEQVKITLDALSNGQIGGVIYYGYNVVSPEQFKELTEYFKEAGPRAFFAIDQEGGKVQRLRSAKGFTDYPTPKYVAENLSVSEAAATYKAMARELASYNINLNFAPSVDLDDLQNPCPVIGDLDRSYSDKSEIVEQYADCVVEQHRSEGVLTCIKHFPGHGRAVGDTHLGLVDVTKTFSNEELEPFYNLIKQNKVDMIMTGHVINRNFDDLPATLSIKILQNLLRAKGYDGVVIGDDLLMRAIIDHYGLEEAIIMSINAGCDMVLISDNMLACKGSDHCRYVYPEEIFTIIKNAVTSGKITMKRISESVNRINRLHDYLLEIKGL